MHYCSDPVQTLANVLAHAQYEGFPQIEYEDREYEGFPQIEYEDREYEGFPQIEYEDRDWSQKERVMVTKTRRHRVDDIAVIGFFPQAWGSTALGFGGIGGQAITTAYTIVLESAHFRGYAVYFGGRFAYNVKKASEQFYLDLQGQNMSAVSYRRKYEKEE